MVALAGKSRFAHAAVGAAVGGIGVLTLLGILGQSHPEHFDSKQVVVAPAGGEALRVTEVVDIDFGRARRHGYERKIPNDFGRPADVVASSADAPDRVGVSNFGTYTRIRIGDPDVTISGAHRYLLSYTYPEAQLSSGRLALDIIGTDETFRTDSFEVIVTGLELADPECHVGNFDDSGGCELVDDGTVYRTVFSPLEPGQGITIAGDITGERPIADVEAPARPDTARPSTIPLTIATTALGGVSGVGVHQWMRRRGRNEVYAGGAADAAFGFRPPLHNWYPDDLPPPDGDGTAAGARSPGAGPDRYPAVGGNESWAPPTDPPASTAAPSSAPAIRLVADAEFAALATTEFVPPEGVDPWLGRVLLTETYDDNLVAMWLSGLAARGIVDVTTSGKKNQKVTLSLGPRFERAAPDDQQSLRRMLGSRGSIELGKYSKTFAKEWKHVAARQRKFVASSGMWKRPLPDVVVSALALVLTIVILVGLAILIPVGLFVPSFGPLSTVAGALVTAAAIPALVATLVYRRLLPARTAAGSALTLRTESFRRFLAASEARHVEWAWKHGLLREYSAWAVALGTASTWESAINASAIPPDQTSTLAPLLLYQHSSALSRAHTQPSSSGSGGSSFGGGGFSGGSVGGGGGGGSSGSW